MSRVPYKTLLSQATADAPRLFMPCLSEMEEDEEMEGVEEGGC